MCIRADIVPLMPKLSQRARKLTLNDGSWEDLLHATIVRALEAESQFTPGTKLSAWLFTIMRNIHINGLRHHGFITYVEPDCDLFMTLKARSARSARDELMDVQRRFDSLPPWARQILSASMQHEMHYRSIADELGMNIGTVKSRLSRARELLRA